VDRGRCEAPGRAGAGRELNGPVAKFGNGRERAWTGSDLPRETQPGNHANPPVPRPTDKVCDRPGKTGRAGAGSGGAGRGSRAVRSSAAAATAIARASLCDGTGRIASNRPLSLRIWIHQPSCGTSVRTAV
jgi:hypothetical protein